MKTERLKSHIENLIYNTFIDDEEKMKNFYIMTKDEFLKYYCNLTDFVYDATALMLNISEVIRIFYHRRRIKLFGLTDKEKEYIRNDIATINEVKEQL